MNTSLIHSPRLKEGDLVRLVSPASYSPESDIAVNSGVLESWGLRCDVGQHVLDKHGYMAGSDADRLKDLNNAFNDPNVRAILTTRGGAGAYRIADDIDFSAARSDPKPLIGFSDITYLHLSLLHHCGLGGVHGCLWGSNAQRTVKHLLMSTDPLALSVNPEAVSAGVKISGQATGRIIGGHLQSVATSIGVRMPSLHGAILFLEYNKRSGLGSVDRYLTQLIRSGALDGVVGVVLGSFECLKGHTDRGWTIIDVLNDRLGMLNVPVLGGIDAGHDLTDDNGDPDQYALPLGSVAALDTDKGTLTIQPIVY
ncbi:MAG: LD-carboxypeptidase [Gammaproteobacteria bacterium]|nr:LD-carboxypeptidase [Gammaproteobacteria bacterium]